MYELLALYAWPQCAGEPVVCLDEKSTKLLADSRAALPMRPGRPLRQDYEYRRQGTCEPGRNAAMPPSVTIEWSCTRQNADQKMRHHVP